MPRFVSIALASVLLTAPVQAQVVKDRVPSPWQVPEEKAAEPNFDIVDDGLDTSGTGTKGSRIIAGTEVMANTSIGFGLFGEKAERQDHAKSINRDYSVPKSRKAGLGVALRF